MRISGGAIEIGNFLSKYFTDCPYKRSNVGALKRTRNYLLIIL